MANGGEYRGDLTKDVTHLIAYAAEGKKYQYATQWEIKVVGLKWLKDSLARRMILEEALYHPNIPQDELGAGAWNRQAKAEVQLGKRPRENDAVADIPRKLRRTASMKLGSQSETLWCEIVNGPPSENSARSDQLRPSKSLPVLKSVVLEPKSFTADGTGMDDARRKLVTTDSHITGQHVGKGIFSRSGCYLHAFTAKQVRRAAPPTKRCFTDKSSKMSILQEHILSNDGQVFDSLTDLDQTNASEIARLFLIVPHCQPSSDIPSVEYLNRRLEVVSDMWAERCLQSKRFVEPDEHVLSRPIRTFPLPGFEKLIVNSTGLANIDLLQVSKVIKLLGAKYDQILKCGISLLLCNASKAGEDKLRHAREWRIPTVSIEWLWGCIRSGKMESFGPFLLKQGPNSKPTTSDPKAATSARPPEAKKAHGENLAIDAQNVCLASGSKEPVHNAPLPKTTERGQTWVPQRAKLIPGEGFLDCPHHGEDVSRLGSEETPTTTDLAAANRRGPWEECNDDNPEPMISMPLREISPNSPPKHERPATPHMARLFSNPDGRPSPPDRGQHDANTSTHEVTATRKTAYQISREESINGAIKELLSKSKAKDMKSATSNGNKQKRLLGRALSNMSNSSREGSNVRASQASSIDSVNTDGLGSVILDETLQTRRATDACADGRSGFTERAFAQERGGNEFLFDLRDAALYREEYQQDEEPPPMTQLGYDNPEEAVALREILAERRRNRTRKGQEDVKPPDPKEEKRVKDDITIAAGGWRTGRRTRQKAKSP